MRPKSMGAVQQSAKNAHVHSYEITRAHLTVALQRRRHANFGVRRAFSTHAASHTALQWTARPSRLRATPLRRPTPTRCTFALVTSQIHPINSKKLLHYRQRKVASLLRLTIMTLAHAGCSLYFTVGRYELPQNCPFSCDCEIRPLPSNA